MAAKGASQAQNAQRPGLQGGVNLLQAALAGGGAGLWMGGMIPIPGAAVALGAAGAIAAPVGMTAMSMLGGMAQPEITGVGRTVDPTGKFLGGRDRWSTLELLRISY